MITKILILPGWQDSGPKHWQGIWLKKYSNAVKVEQKDWFNCAKEDWIRGLNDCIEKYKGDEIVLVGHSLACVVIAFWAEEYGATSSAKIKGALLVSPSDMETAVMPKEITGFAPMPLAPLGFRTIVAVSSTDPWVSMKRAEYFAKCWGAELVNVGDKGHINTDAGFGQWSQGEELLARLLK